MAGDNIPRYLAHNRSWLDGMAMLRTAGVKLQHYLHLRNLTCSKRTPPGTCTGGSSCCLVPDGSIQPKNRCCNSLENVTAIVEAAIKYFPEDGIFQDNGPFSGPAVDSEIRTLDQLREFEVAAYNLTQRAAGPGGREVSGNGFDYWVHGPKSPNPHRKPGHSDWALETLNETMVHETTVPVVPPIPPGWPASRFSVLVGGVNNATMRHWVDRFLEAGWGGICAVDAATKACGYCGLPDFWEEEVAYLANRSRARRSKSDDSAGAAAQLSFHPPAFIGLVGGGHNDEHRAHAGNFGIVNGTLCGDSGVSHPSTCTALFSVAIAHLLSLRRATWHAVVRHWTPSS